MRIILVAFITLSFSVASIMPGMASDKRAAGSVLQLEQKRMPVGRSVEDFKTAQKRIENAVDRVSLSRSCDACEKPTREIDHAPVGPFAPVDIEPKYDIRPPLNPPTRETTETISPKESVGVSLPVGPIQPVEVPPYYKQPPLNLPTRGTTENPPSKEPVETPPVTGPIQPTPTPPSITSTDLGSVSTPLRAGVVMQAVTTHTTIDPANIPDAMWGNNNSDIRRLALLEQQRRARRGLDAEDYVF